MINGIDEETERYYKEVNGKHPCFTYFQHPTGLKVGDARNEIIGKSTGEYLCFIDDDIELPQDYFQAAYKIISSYQDVDVFGGPDQTKKDANNFKLILGEVMQSYIAMGPTAKRHKSSGDSIIAGTEINLILCNLWMKKSLFDDGFAFPQNYIRGEENILLGQLKTSGKALIYSPKLLVFHERKGSFGKLAKATYYSAQYRTIGFFDEVSTFKWYFLVPQVALITLAMTIICCPLMACILLGIYLCIITIKSLLITIKLKKVNCIHLSITFFILYNFVYTIGLFSGYYKVLFKHEKL